MSVLEFTVAKAIVHWHNLRHGAASPIELLKKSQYSGAWQAVIIVPSAKRARWWQLSFFDAHGFYGDSQHPSKLDAVEEAMSEKYYILSHGQLERAMKSPLWHADVSSVPGIRASKTHTHAL